MHFVAFENARVAAFLFFTISVKVTGVFVKAIMDIYL